MGKSRHLRLGDVRATLRLVGECRDLGYDPVLWRRQAFEGLGPLVGVQVVNGGEIHWPRPDGPITLIQSVEVGLPQATGSDADLPAGEGDPEIDPTSEAIKAIRPPPGRLVTRTRRQLLPDRAWYRSAHYQKYHRPTGTDHYAVSIWELPGDRLDGIGVYRAEGDRDFAPRELNLLRLVHAELGRLIGPVLVPADDSLSPARLPPRVRETLYCLLDGDSEKQAAARMGLSRETVHQYVKALYRHYRVASRAELLARVLRRPIPNPGPGAPPA